MNQIKYFNNLHNVIKNINIEEYCKAFVTPCFDIIHYINIFILHYNTFSRCKK